MKDNTCNFAVPAISLEHKLSYNFIQPIVKSVIFYIATCIIIMVIYFHPNLQHNDISCNWRCTHHLPFGIAFECNYKVKAEGYALLTAK